MGIISALRPRQGGTGRGRVESCGSHEARGCAASRIVHDTEGMASFFRIILVLGSALLILFAVIEVVSAITAAVVSVNPDLVSGLFPR